MNILFRADSSSTLGTGHIMRDLVLAKRLLKEYPNATISFAMQNLVGSSKELIKDAGYRVVLLKSNEKKELLKILQAFKCTLLVIDHYSIDYKFEKSIKKKFPTLQLYVLDDTYKKHYCDTLLNHNLGADKKRYKKLVPKGCRVLCGERYTLLREEFYTEKQKHKKKRTKKKRIFLAMGGADTAWLNVKILKVLLKYKHIEVDVLTTDANRKLAKLTRFVSQQRNNHLHINTQKVAKLLRKSDLAIITPSVILNEVSFMQIPFIAIQTAKNQKELAKFLQKKRLPLLKKFSKKKFTKLLKKSLHA